MVIQRFYKFIVAGVSLGILMAFLVVYADVSDSTIMHNESVIEEVVEAVPEVAVAEQLSEVVTDEGIEAENEEILISTTTEDSNTPVVPDSEAVITEDATSTLLITEEVTAEPQALPTETSRAEDAFLFEDILHTPQDCLNEAWRSLFRSPGECVRDLRSGEMR
jgi:hypothetical protein